MPGASVLCRLPHRPSSRCANVKIHLNAISLQQLHAFWHAYALVRASTLPAVFGVRLDVVIYLLNSSHLFLFTKVQTCSGSPPAALQC